MLCIAAAAAAAGFVAKLSLTDYLTATRNIRNTKLPKQALSVFLPDRGKKSLFRIFKNIGFFKEQCFWKFEGKRLNFDYEIGSLLDRRNLINCLVLIAIITDWLLYWYYIVKVFVFSCCDYLKWNKRTHHRGQILQGKHRSLRRTSKS